MSRDGFFLNSDPSTPILLHGYGLKGQRPGPSPATEPMDAGHCGPAFPPTYNAWRMSCTSTLVTG